MTVEEFARSVETGQGFDITDYDCLGDSRQATVESTCERSFRLALGRPVGSQGRHFYTMTVRWADGDWTLEGETLILWRRSFGSRVVCKKFERIAP